MSIFILNWNGARFLTPCLTSVCREACRHVDVVVVDNGSTDDSVRVIQEFPGVRLIAFPSNLGYGTAYNAAANSVSSPYLVFLNNDTVVEPGWLDPLVDELIANPRAALTTSKVLFLGTSVINSLGGQLKLWQGPLEIDFGRDARDLNQRHTTEPFFASGAAMAISKAIFDSLEGFDPLLSFYCEDLDLSWRARLAGYTILCASDSVVYHHLSGTAGVLNPDKLRLVTTHYVAVMVKCLSTHHLLHSLPAYTVFALAKGISLAILERNAAYFVSVVRALRETLRTRQNLLQRRRLVQQRRVVPDRVALKSEGFGLVVTPFVLLRHLMQGRRIHHQPDRQSGASAPKSSIS